MGELHCRHDTTRLPAKRRLVQDEPQRLCVKTARFTLSSGDCRVHHYYVTLSQSFTAVVKLSSTASTDIYFRLAACFSLIHSVSFLPFFLPLFPSPRSGPSNPAKGFGEALLDPSGGTTTFAVTKHVPWALNTPKVH